jgi:methionyl aminopeptidase
MKKGMVKTEAEIEAIAEGGKLLQLVLHKTASLVRPNVSTWELSEFAKKEILKVGGIPSFIGYGPKGQEFQDALCTSVNDVVVHGIPSKKTLLESGDIVGLDIGMVYKGFFTDTAITVPVGKVSALASNIIQAAKEALAKAIEVARVGSTIGDIAFATQNTAERAGFSVVRDLVGHGVGYGLQKLYRLWYYPLLPPRSP